MNPNLYISRFNFPPKLINFPKADARGFSHRKRPRLITREARIYILILNAFTLLTWHSLVFSPTIFEVFFWFLSRENYPGMHFTGWRRTKNQKEQKNKKPKFGGKKLVGGSTVRGFLKPDGFPLSSPPPPRKKLSNWTSEIFVRSFTSARLVFFWAINQPKVVIKHFENFKIVLSNSEFR